MATQRKSASVRKAEIVSVAIRLAGEHGPDRVTTQQLAEVIGISQPAIFRHFPTKADIWLEVGKAITGRTSMQEGDDLQNSNDPLAILDQRMAGHLTQISLNPAIPAILFSRELHAENEQLRQHFEIVIRNRRAGLARLIDRAQTVGQLKTGTKAGDIAALLLAVVQGLAMRWSLENRGFDLVEEGTRLIREMMQGFQNS